METHPNSTVLVTGANGFLGSHIVKQLINSQYHVKAFVLTGTSTKNLDGLNVEIVVGDLLSKVDLEKAIIGCQYVIHTAAITDVWPTKSTLSWKINYQLIKILADVIRSSSIEKFIHIGTANSFGFGSITQPGNETSPFNKSVALFDYILSKKAAQDFLLKQVNIHPPLPVVILNPTFMIGEADTKPGSGAMILSLLHRKVPGYARGGRSFAPVKDVARAAVLALEKGRIGSCYIVGGHNLSYQHFFQMVGRVANVKAPRRYVPTFFAITIAFFIELFAKLKSQKPVLTVKMAALSGQGHYYDSAKAIQELGYQMTSLETAIQEAVTWFKANGYVKLEQD